MPGFVFGIGSRDPATSSYIIRMGKTYGTLDEVVIEFIRRQHVFFVATAPLCADGLVNVSPKGQDTLRVLGPSRVAYLDLTGSGVETIAHVKENGRIVLMFCAFEGPPKIVRLHGRGSVIVPADDAYPSLASNFPPHPGARAIVHVELTRIADSCGYAVPLYAYEGDRDVLDKWTEKKGPEGLIAYRAGKNTKSLDGLKGL